MFESDIRDYADELERVYRVHEPVEQELREEVARAEARPTLYVSLAIYILRFKYLFEG